MPNPSGDGFRILSAVLGPTVLLNIMKEKSMSDSKNRAVRTTLKDDRAREAARAMNEYEAKRAADLKKAARLRALRLAHEAGVVAPAKTPND
jgi:hypothetical protein